MKQFVNLSNEYDTVLDITINLSVELRDFKLASGGLGPRLTLCFGCRILEVVIAFAIRVAGDAVVWEIYRKSYKGRTMVSH